MQAMWTAEQKLPRKLKETDLFIFRCDSIEDQCMIKSIIQ